MRVRRIVSITAGFAALVLLMGARASEALLIGPVPYLSAADIPAGFYTGAPFIEDFEGCLDGATFPDPCLDPGILSASAGFVITPSHSTFGGSVDSVDGDDGTIDGSGSAGSSWFFTAGTPTAAVTFTFAVPAAVSAAGIVWTDGSNPVTFEAFDAGGVSLGTIGPVAIADAMTTGQTAEDRFFGVVHGPGISAIKLTSGPASGPTGIEVDHVQYGVAGPIPEPRAPLLFAMGMTLALATSRRRPQRATR